MRKSKEEGRKEGREEGQSEGLSLMSRLVNILMDADRLEDVKKAANDSDYRLKLMREFNLIE